MKKVAIVGYTNTKEQAPYKNEEFEIWGLNDLYELIPQYSRWFEIHPKERVNTLISSRTGKKHIDSLRNLQCPVYMQDHYKDIPNSIKYPLKEVQEHISECILNEDFNGYFTNTISYMVALAIYEKFEEIHIYGVDMALGDNEYWQQRPSVEFWLGVAAGRGIKIYVPTQSDLLTALFLYGYQRTRQGAFQDKITQIMKDIEGKKQQATAEEQKHRDWKNQLTGAQEGIKELKARWLLTREVDK